MFMLYNIIWKLDTLKKKEPQSSLDAVRVYIVTVSIESQTCLKQVIVSLFCAF